MNRRDFLRRSALLAAGAVAADQLELLDRLGWVRRWFPGFGAGMSDDPFAAVEYLSDQGHGIVVTKAQWDALLRDVYTDPLPLASAFAQAQALPFRARKTSVFTAGRQWVPALPTIEVVRG